MVAWYDFLIVYKPSSVNKATDALARKENIVCSSLGGPRQRQWDSLKQELERDEL